MRWNKLLGWGIVIYAIAYLAASGLALYGGASNPTSAKVTLLAVLIATLTIAGRSLRLQHWQDILPYSLWWAVMFALLDALYRAPFSSTDIYADPNIWIAYGLVITVPLLAPQSSRTYKHLSHEY